MALGFWMNNKNCYGCKTCSIACKSEKQLNNGVLLRHVTEIKQDNPLAFAFLSMACNHCDDPACMKNCPVGAYSKRDDGIVVQDHSLCIGCKTCVEACPYGAPCYDEETSTTFKCDMCIARQEQGLKPACVEACPGMNIEIGEMEELQKAYKADIVSDDSAGTKPNFVITVDPNLESEPDDVVLEAAE
jgi:DMSO reductase iron-sulfur subunit